MTKKDSEQKSPNVKESRQVTKQTRLSEALRKNLRRRKKPTKSEE